MPLKIPVGRIGEWRHPRYGVLKMSQQMFDEMKDNFKAKTIGRDPYVRIGHKKTDEPTFGAEKSEGWVQDLVQEGDVLYALADPTNDEVGEMVRTKQYRYASAEYLENYKSKEDGSSKGAVLEAIALTNEPFLTRLPEARLLADPPDTFYLDFEEVNPGMEGMKELLEQQKEGNGLLRKLADFLTGKKPEEVTPPTPAAAPPVESPETKKLSDMQTQLDETRKALHTAEVERKLVEYVGKGIPPAVLDGYKPILLADSGEKTIKLADDKAVSVSEQLYAQLDTFPQEGRIKLSQLGEQTTPPPANSPEAIKKLADQDMTELGYSVDEHGRYKLV